MGYNMFYYNINNIYNSKLLFDNFVFFCSPPHSLLEDFTVSKGHRYPLVYIYSLFYYFIMYLIYYLFMSIMLDINIPLSYFCQIIFTLDICVSLHFNF
jgi:hypothetical protein